jgi:hypothetical protein
MRKEVQETAGRLIQELERLHPGIAVELLDVNFVNQMEFPEARVRFYPNGTSDEFTTILLWNRRTRAKISLEVVTGLADVEFLR